jgi:hypothetical protein
MIDSSGSSAGCRAVAFDDKIPAQILPRLLALAINDDSEGVVASRPTVGFRSLVEAMQRRGVHVTVSTIATQPPMIADELRREADAFTDLAELQVKVGRDPSERQAARERSDPRRQRAQRPTSPRLRGQTSEIDPEVLALRFQSRRFPASKSAAGRSVVRRARRFSTISYQAEAAGSGLRPRAGPRGNSWRRPHLLI